MLKAIPYAAVDGFIVCGLEEDRGEVQALQQRAIPTVMVDGEDHEGFPTIGVDEESGTRQLMEHLLRLGHRRFAFVVIDTDRGDDESRWRGTVKKRIDAIVDVLRSEGMDLHSPRAYGTGLITPLRSSPSATSSPSESSMRRIARESMCPDRCRFPDSMILGRQ